jgi:hypothetical protein
LYIRIFFPGSDYPNSQTADILQKDCRTLDRTALLSRLCHCNIDGTLFGDSCMCSAMTRLALRKEPKISETLNFASFA